MKKLAIVLGLALALTGASFAQEAKTGDTKKTTATAPKKGTGKGAPAAEKKAPEKATPPEATKGGKKGAEKAPAKAAEKQVK